MRYLLDTHTFIWSVTNPGQISGKVLGILSNRSNEIYLSHVSLWEIVIKETVGKLTDVPELRVLLERAEISEFKILPVSLEDIKKSRELPLLHKDPFDRMLVAQTLQNTMVLLSKDKMVRQYAADMIW